ncbi:alpha/beta fold hydrolase [Yimella sp. RIT 621]|uniref:alpha/beta fold hydrolase n=1 Tax=Yimella sp. RIT 621 TaxID=2510323 RepID=UPI00101C81BE|nr:alpha/beta fold hydrolase [Yimella sp. RIT 621]RYG77268.1 alpha/beta fold hydrolase [Yimella sp. RIT 621]
MKRLPGIRPTRRIIAIAAAIALLAVAAIVGVYLRDDDPADAVRRTDTVLDTGGARIDTSWFTPKDAGGGRPTVLLGHGFGGNKTDLLPQAQRLVGEGYNVLTWSARGFGRSTGRISLNAPGAEVADVSTLLDWVAKQPNVLLDKAGDPRAGMAGGSYGGGIALMTAALDHRVDAIAASITYWDLADALVPNGVFKKTWAGVFFNNGGGCAKFDPALCAAYTRIAETGRATAPDLKLLRDRSPVAVGDRIKAPTLLLQGQSDSLFPLDQADRAARRIAGNRTPVAVDWIAGGHDGGDAETDRVEQRTLAWFDQHLKRESGNDTAAFRVSRRAGTNTQNGSALLRGASRAQYPGLLGTSSNTIALTGRPQSFANPPGGQPADVSSLPGTGALGDAGEVFDLSLNFPGQSAAFSSAPLTEAVTVTGTPRVRLKVGSSTPEAVLFVKLYDVGPGRSQPVLPARLATPIRVETGGSEREVEVTLPAIDRRFETGHRIRLVVSSTDMGYATPAKAATYRVSIAGALTVPVVGSFETTAEPLPTWVWLLPLLALLAAGAILFGRRRRTTAEQVEEELADVPLQITGLTKAYGGNNQLSVDDLSFTVERGQVLGLLGPNGAGKTSTLRMLMGLTMPDAGEIRVFGRPIQPGAPVLTRLGAFVEGPGFLPHLSGRANLDLYWQATGRPAQEAHLDEALEVAALSDEALARPVRTYSQGMRQRLAIAQAMLGLPDVLVLDEPTNGLDPGQIRQMRQVMSAYAVGGRTVIVSSHLLAEVEQFCTHLVVMDRGRLVRAGTVAEIVGDGRLEETFLRIVAEGGARQ